MPLFILVPFAPTFLSGVTASQSSQPAVDPQSIAKQQADLQAKILSILNPGGGAKTGSALNTSSLASQQTVVPSQCRRCHCSNCSKTSNIEYYCETNISAVSSPAKTSCSLNWHCSVNIQSPSEFYNSKAFVFLVSKPSWEVISASITFQ